MVLLTSPVVVACILAHVAMDDAEVAKFLHPSRDVRLALPMKEGEGDNVGVMVGISGKRPGCRCGGREKDAREIQFHGLSGINEKKN